LSSLEGGITEATLHCSISYYPPQLLACLTDTSPTTFIYYEQNETASRADAILPLKSFDGMLKLPLGALSLQGQKKKKMAYLFHAKR
jgi:hypothetical protein